MCAGALGATAALCWLAFSIVLIYLVLLHSLRKGVTFFEIKMSKTDFKHPSDKIPTESLLNMNPCSEFKHSSPKITPHPQLRTRISGNRLHF